MGENNSTLNFPGPYYSLWSIPSRVDSVGEEFKKIYDFLKETLCFPEKICRFIIVYNENGSCSLSCLYGAVRYGDRNDCFSGKTPGLALANLYRVLEDGKEVDVRGGDDENRTFNFRLSSEQGKLTLKDISISSL